LQYAPMIIDTRNVLGRLAPKLERSAQSRSEQSVESGD
jgi:hypothetical protein